MISTLQESKAASLVTHRPRVPNAGISDRSTGEGSSIANGSVLDLCQALAAKASAAAERHVVWRYRATGRAEQNRRRRDIERHLSTDRSYLDEGLRPDATYRQPFDLPAEPVAAQETQKAAGRASDGCSEKWLPFLDAYRTMCMAPEPAFKRVLEEIEALGLAG